MSRVGTGLMRFTKLYYSAFIPAFVAGVAIAKALDAEPHSRKDGALLLGTVFGALAGYANVRAGQMDHDSGDGEDTPDSGDDGGSGEPVTVEIDPEPSGVVSDE